MIDSINRTESSINHFKYQVFVLMKEFQKSVITGNANYKIIKPSFMSENIISLVKKFNLRNNPFLFNLEDFNFTF